MSRNSLSMFSAMNKQLGITFWVEAIVGVEGKRT
jgi:hypothetical protein